MAQASGDISASPAASGVAFEIDAVLMATNVSRNLSDDNGVLDLARVLTNERLSVRPRRPPAQRRRPAA